MNEVNLFIILGTTIVCLLIFTLIIYFLQKKGYELLQEKVNNNKLINENESKDSERRISELIDPIAKELEKLQSNVNTIEKNRIESYGRLSEQVDILAYGTKQLEQALRSPTTRGKWGEIQLQRVLELSGMTEHIDFNTQKGIEDTSARPDAIINLPGEKFLAIDAKTPLNSYIDATESKTEKEKNENLEKHAKNIKKTAKLLGQKDYQKSLKGNFDFVIMFIPGDHFFSAAIKLDPDIFENALKNKVLICTPTTLIALLKGVSYNWQHEKLTKNVEEIAKHSQELQYRVIKFFEYMDGIKKGLETASDHYNKAIGSIENRVLPQISKISNLGAMNNKNIKKTPSKLEINIRNKNVKKTN